MASVYQHYKGQVRLGSILFMLFMFSGVVSCECEWSGHMVISPMSYCGSTHSNWTRLT